MDPLEPTTSTYRPRQSSYLRISPSSVLQMILYLEPSHTHWMNVRTTTCLSSSYLPLTLSDFPPEQDGVLERVLFALKDRIPLKLQQEGDGKKHGKEKTHVDVFRGGTFAPSLVFLLFSSEKDDADFCLYRLPLHTADYQMAFFFRRSNDKHVVLLKVRLPFSPLFLPLLDFDLCSVPSLGQTPHPVHPRRPSSPSPPRTTSPLLLALEIETPSSSSLAFFLRHAGTTTASGRRSTASLGWRGRGRRACE